MKALYSLLLLAVPAFADGPHIALHNSQGAYTATLFTAPDPLVTGKADLALLVTRGEDGSAIPVRQAHVSVELHGGKPTQVILEPSSGEMEGSTVLAQAGRYVVAVFIETDQGDVVRLTGTLPVDVNHGRRNVVLWSVLFPLLAILVFLANQSAKQKLRIARKT